jgi:hypothetical protein
VKEMANVVNFNLDSSLDDPTPGGVVGLANAYNLANGLMEVVDATSEMAIVEVDGEKENLAEEVQSGGEKDEVNDSGEDEVEDEKEEEEKDGYGDEPSDAEDKGKSAKKSYRVKDYELYFCPPFKRWTEVKPNSRKKVWELLDQKSK